jgi:hypothetical protein
MYVYGIRCAPNDLLGLPADAEADYYIDYGLLVFPAYTRSTCLRANRASGLTSDFWHRGRLLLQFANKTHCASEIEHPWISEGESAVVKSLQEFYPGLQADWYYVPRTFTQSSDPTSADD